MIFGINTTSDVSLRQFWNIMSGIYAKYYVQIVLLFVYTNTRKRFVIFTCRYFKLSWNTTALSQSNCRNFSCSSIIKKIQFTHFPYCSLPWVPPGWVPEVFLACGGGNFRCWPKADTSSVLGRSHERRAGHLKDLTETGKRARKVSGTQGNWSLGSKTIFCKFRIAKSSDRTVVPFAI